MKRDSEDSSISHRAGTRETKTWFYSDERLGFIKYTEELQKILNDWDFVKNPKCTFFVNQTEYEVCCLGPLNFRQYQKYNRQKVRLVKFEEASSRSVDKELKRLNESRKDPRNRFNAIENTNQIFKSPEIKKKVLSQLDHPEEYLKEMSIREDFKTLETKLDKLKWNLFADLKKAFFYYPKKKIIGYMATLKNLIQPY